MPFGMLSGVGRWMGVLDGVVIVEGEGAVLGVNLERPIVTNGAFATRLFSNCCEDLFNVCKAYAESWIHSRFTLLYGLPHRENILIKKNF